MARDDVLGWNIHVEFPRSVHFFFQRLQHQQAGVISRVCAPIRFAHELPAAGAFCLVDRGRLDFDPILSQLLVGSVYLLDREHILHGEGHNQLVHAKNQPGDALGFFHTR